MARTNVAVAFKEKTHEGATAARQNKEQQLRRLVMANMLWEDQFYVDGQTTVGMIQDLVRELPGSTVALIAVEARKDMKLRHVPLLLARELARHPKTEERQHVSNLLYQIIDRPDELAEFMAIYWKNGTEPVSAQVKKGLARAFSKFNEYQFAKWQKADSAIKLRDVMFMVHPHPHKHHSSVREFSDNSLLAREILYKAVAEQELETPDTWEVALSAGADKKATWERLISENKLGALAVLRNLRNMREVGVGTHTMQAALNSMNTERVLPFRFISAAKHAPLLEADLEQAMFKCLANHEPLGGKTVLLVDVSGSMNGAISSRSDLTRLDAAAGLAMLLREICENVQIGAFDTTVRWCRPRRGFALKDEIGLARGGTYIGDAVSKANKEGYDRIIVLTDEQSADSVPSPLKGSMAYMINVAAYKNGIGSGPWTRVDGWSEAIVSYIVSLERCTETDRAA